MTPLPVDSTGNATFTDPMDGNDRYGCCYEATGDHADRILMWRQGRGVQLPDTTPALLKQYLAKSGGDNGLSEDDMVGPQGNWTAGLGGDPSRVVVDHLDLDMTNGPLVQYAIDQFYFVALEWCVPDAFIQGFDLGTVWPAAAKPDPRNGHATPLADVGGPSNSAHGTAPERVLSPVHLVGVVLGVPGVRGQCRAGRLRRPLPAAVRRAWLRLQGPPRQRAGQKRVAAGGNAAIAAKLVSQYPAIGPTPPVPTPTPPAGQGVVLSAADLTPAAPARVRAVLGAGGQFSVLV